MLPVLDDVTGSEAPGDAGQAPTLPADAPALRAQLDALCGSDPSCIADVTSAYVESYVVPATLLSAMWEALGEADGVTVIDEVPDRLGRPSVAVWVPGGAAGQPRVVYGDPKTGVYLGRDIVRPGVSGPRSLREHDVLESIAVVSATLLSEEDMNPPSPTAP